MSYPGLPLNLEDDFRLVEIRPGKFDDPIRCSLFSTRLSNAPDYEALSYTWGDLSQTEPIRIEDSNGFPSDLLVTTNCVAALRRIRKLRTTRLLWIDAICIDQNEINERNHQLGLMAQIYTKAIRVLIYLGEASDDSDSAMDWIRRIDSPDLDVSSPSTWITPRETVLRPSTGMIESLLDRPWFHRVWVLQEAILNKSANVYCGNKCISWNAFKQFKRFNTNTKWINTLPYVLQRANVIRNPRVVVEWQVLTELMEARNCDATDSRDKVYALIPLLSNSGIEFEIQPDYSSSTNRVFIEVATYFLNVLGLEILCAVRGTSSIPGLPSWIPDWGIRIQRSTLGLTLLDMTRSQWVKNGRHKAGGSRFVIPNGEDGAPKNASSFVLAKADPKDSIPTQLKLKALRIGKITKVGDPYKDGDNIPSVRQWKSIAAELIKTSTFLQDTYEVPYDIFVSTIVTGNVVYADVLVDAVGLFTTDDANYIGEDFFRNWLKSLPVSYRRQVEMIFEACRGRRLSVTDTGYLGLAPLEAENEDIVYIVPGVSVPFVLRKVGDVFRLVGECYVQNVMDGEALQGIDPSKMEDIVIV